MRSNINRDELPPTVLIQDSIEQLERLSGYLADQVLAAHCQQASLPPRERLDKEALPTITILPPKLYAVRNAHALPMTHRITEIAPAAAPVDDGVGRRE